MSYLVLRQEELSRNWVGVGFSNEIDPKEAIRDATKRHVSPGIAYVALEWKPAARCLPRLSLMDVPPNGSKG